MIYFFPLAGRGQIVGWAKRSVPTIEVRHGGHGAKSAFAHPTPIAALNCHCERSHRAGQRPDPLAPRNDGK
jgi:hypothetical protein